MFGAKKIWPAGARKTLRWFASGAIVATVLTVVGQVAGLAGAPVYTSAASASSGPIYWGAYVDGASWQTAPIDTFESQIGKKMSIVHWGQPWIMNGAYQPFQTSNFQAMRNRGSIPMVNW